MEAKGYIKISRQVLSLDIWRDPYDCRLFFFCLLRASHNHYGSLQPGQFYYSVQSMAIKLNWSRNSVAKHIRVLCEAGLLSAEHTAEGSVLTILRWGELSGETVLKAADSPAESDAHTLCMDAQPLTENAQPKCIQCTPVEHYQNSNQEQPKTLSQRECEFENWWKKYPRHERKSEARKAWMALRDVPAEKLIKALESAKRSPTWNAYSGRFIPSAAKWLDGNWEDYAEPENEVITEWTEY